MIPPFFSKVASIVLWWIIVGFHLLKVKMNTDKNLVADLFQRYYHKTATVQEIQQLFLLMEGLGNEELELLMADGYNGLEEEGIAEYDKNKDAAFEKIFFKKVLETKPKIGPVLRLWSKIAVAASVLFLLGYFIFFNASKHQFAPAIVQRDTIRDAAPGGNKAILTLADGSMIALDDAQDGVLAKQGNITVNKTQNGQVVYTVNSTGTQHSTETVINKISTPRGGQFQVVLPDGSKAWLNAASSISFPTVFAANERKVDMTGEVYFEITKNKIPFIVGSQKGSIQVLGTHFNVMAYDDEQAMETTLLEGSVKINSGGSVQVIKPGQQARVLNKGSVNIASDIDVDGTIAWKSGLFQFKDADLESVLRQISRWYDRDIIYEGKMPDKQINAKISRNVNVSEVLDMLRYNTSLEFTIDGNRITVK